MRECLARLIDAYEERVDAIERLMVRAAAELERAGSEREELLERLAGRLAGSHSLRKSDFDRMVEGLRKRRRAREQELATALRDFEAEDRRIIATLRQVVSADANAATAAEIGAAGRELAHLQNEREARIGGLLRSFHMEHEELRAMLEAIVGRDAGLRIKDIRALVRGHLAWAERLGEAQSVLDDVGAARRAAAERWRPVMTDAGHPVAGP
jgi:hypothetical protein